MNLGRQSLYVVGPQEVDANYGIARRPLSTEEDGGLSSDLFRGHLVELSLRHRQISISERLPMELSCESTCGQLTMASSGEYGPMTLVASGFEINKQKISVRIDTIYSGALFLSSGLNPLLYTTDSRVSTGIKAESYLGVRLVPRGYTSLRFGDIILSRNLALSTLPDNAIIAGKSNFQATLGLQSLQLAYFIFDFRSNRIWLNAKAPLHSR